MWLIKVLLIKESNVVLYSSKFSLSSLFLCLRRTSLGQYSQKMLSKVGVLEKIKGEDGHIGVCSIEKGFKLSAHYGKVGTPSTERRFKPARYGDICCAYQFF